MAAAADAEVVDAAVAHIRSILNRTLARGMEEVGEYLLKTFFRDDPALYTTTGARHLSLRALVERCGTIELPVSATFLSSSIRIAVVARRLPEGASFRKLPVSHRVELLRLPEERIEPVATDALRAQLAVRELRTRVTKMLVAQPHPRGRPRSPTIVRVSAALERAILDGDGATLAFDRTDAAGLTTAQKRKARAAIARVSALLRRLAELIGDE